MSKEGVQRKEGVKGEEIKEERTRRGPGEIRRGPEPTKRGSREEQR